MANYKVSLEIEVDADSPLNAAKIVNNILDKYLTNTEAFCRQYYVQQDDSNNVFYVDLNEDDDNAVFIC